MTMMPQIQLDLGIDVARDIDARLGLLKLELAKTETYEECDALLDEMNDLNAIRLSA